jgi:nitrite reductase/ring-hydroxylating ferredoxin subunit
MKSSQYVRAASLADIRARGCLPIQLQGHSLALFVANGGVSAVDNRCPHMGFPLHRGTVKDGVLTCHWHHARFDLSSGGTFDQWADDVRVYPVEMRGDEVWVDLAPLGNMLAHQQLRLRTGLERSISLVMAKAVIGLLDGDAGAAEPFRLGIDFGTKYRQAGWGQGLTIHTCMMNMLPMLAPEDRPRALYHGVAAVANNSAGVPPRFMVQPLPGSAADPAALKRGFDSSSTCGMQKVRSGALSQP